MNCFGEAAFTKRTTEEEGIEVIRKYCRHFFALNSRGHCDNALVDLSISWDPREPRVAEPENLKTVPVPTFYLNTVPVPVPVPAPVLGHVHTYTFTNTDTYLYVYIFANVYVYTY
jgi:hypothetical protein